MIAEVRYLKKIMASSTLNGEAAGWCKLPGKDLVIPTGGIWGERKKEQLKQRMVTNRILETEEKQNILDESIVTDEGKGAASILWQGWGGGRKEDVEKYCLDNFVWEDGQIRTNRDQTKNESCKMVTALMNFYFMAFFLMKTGRWNAECFRNGYSSNTRKRILTKAGFWAESWADSLSIADQMPGSYFAYTAFDCTLDFPDARRLVEFLRKPTPIRDLILAGMPADHVNRILHGSLRGPGLSEIIADRLNVMMQGPLLYDPSLFPNPNHPPRDRAMYLIKMPNISPANLKCLNRWLIEDALPGLVSSRQSYPRNALRRSGITAYSLLFDDPNRAALYFSSGKKSVETIYNTPAPKKYSREHWTIGYNAISKSLGTDRAYLLPAGHKLDEFRTPEVVEMEGKISEDAATFENSEKGKPKRREGYSAQNPKYTPEERKALTAEYERRISSGEELTLAEYVKEKKMGMTTLTTMLQAVGFRQHRTEEDVRLLVEEFKEEAKRGVSIAEFAPKKNLPSSTLYHYLTDAGVSSDGHTGDEVKALLEQLTQSGMTDAEFARNGGFSLATLSKWKADAAKKATGHQNGSSGDVKNGTEQKNVVVDDYQTCKKNDPDLTPMKFAKLRGIPYSSLRTLFANVGGLLANVKRHSRDEIRQIIEDYDKARDENPELTREDYALRCGITEHTLNTWLSDGFRKLVFSDDGEGPDTDSEEETEEMN
jgi:predicted transcriptional regulator